MGAEVKAAEEVADGDFALPDGDIWVGANGLEVDGLRWRDELGLGLYLEVAFEGFEDSVANVALSDSEVGLEDDLSIGG